MTGKIFGGRAVVVFFGSSLVSVVAILFGVQIAAAATNLIANPSFETSVGSTTPADWQSSSWGDATGAVFTYPVAGEDDAFAAQVSISSYATAGENNGSAEWYFNNVPVTANSLYSFSDWYKSNVSSYLIAAWTLSDGTVSYDALGTLPPASAWTNTPAEVFNAPANAVSVTIFHQLQSAGTLTVDNYSLSADTSPTSSTLPQGMVSLTFDDGWTSQYDNALPILNAAHMNGTLYIITNDISTGSSNNPNLFTLSEVSTSPVTVSNTSTSSGTITWSGLYTDPTYQEYNFGETYSATAPSTVSVSYTQSGQSISTVLGTLPANSAPSSAAFVFTLPTVSGNTVTPITITQTLSSAGTLTASNPSVTEYQPYMTPTQLLAFQGAGDEIGSHTETHPDLTALSTADAMTEIDGSRSALLADGTSPITAFAYPFGNYNTGLEGLVGSAGYTSARSVDVGYNDTTTNPLTLKSYSVVEGTSFSTVKTWIDTAKANKWWLILTFHEIDPASIISANSEVYGTTPEMLQEITSYLSSQNIPVKTVGAALAVVDGVPAPVTPPPPATTTPPVVPPPATTTPPVIPVLKTITITPLSASLVIGKTQQLAAKTLDQNGNAITATLKWSTNNASVATVSSTGLVTAVGAGTTTITASSGTVTSIAPATIAVTAPAPVAPVTPVVPVGTTSFTNGVLSLIGATNSNNTFTVKIASGNRYYGIVDNEGRVAPESSTKQIIVYAGAKTNTITVSSAIKMQIKVILPTGAIQYVQPGTTVTIQG